MIADVKKSAEQKMKKTVETLRTDLAKIRTGRVHTGSSITIMVDYYGTPTPVRRVGNVTLLDARHHRRDSLGQEKWRPDREGDPQFRPGV
jgi:ribosome recycling factor